MRTTMFIILCFCTLLLHRAAATQGNISTVIGGGLNDGAVATQAGFMGPRGVTIDDMGNLYVIDSFNKRIRKIDAPTNRISTIVGNGLTTYHNPLDVPQNGARATQSRLSRAQGLAVDINGNVYFGGGGLVRATPNGIIERLSDPPLGYREKVAIPLVDLHISDAENLYFCTDLSVHKMNLQTRRIIRVTGTTLPGFSGDGGPALLAHIKPRGIFVDHANNIYLASDRYNRIQKVDANTGIITTIAGTGEEGYSGDHGFATRAQLDTPRDVWVDNEGNVLFSDTFNHRVRKIDTHGIITTIVGTGVPGYSGDNGPATQAQIRAPHGLTMDKTGNLYIAERGNQRVRLVNPFGKIFTIAGGFTGDGGLATRAAVNDPTDTITDQQGNIYIADRKNRSLRKIDAQTGIVNTVAGGVNPSQAIRAALDGPQALVFDGANNLFFIDGHRILVFTSTKEIKTIAGSEIAGFSGDGMPAFLAIFNHPEGLAVDSKGNLYIADTQNHRIRKIDAQSGLITTISGTGIPTFSGDNGPATEAALHTPHRICTDENDNLYITDGRNHRIRKIDAASGFITTLVGTGQNTTRIVDKVSALQADIRDPRGVFIDQSGTLFFSEGNDLGRIVFKMAPNTQTLARVAGTGQRFFNGDNQPATEATLYGIQSLFIDSKGNLFLTDRTNNRVRKVEGIATPTTLNPGVFPLIRPESQPPLDPRTDFDQNGKVDFADFLGFAAQFGKSVTDPDFNTDLDFNQDGEINFPDFLLFTQNFGRTIHP